MSHEHVCNRPVCHPFSEICASKFLRQEGVKKLVLLILLGFSF
jgi:hypothetical protein